MLVLQQRLVFGVDFPRELQIGEGVLVGAAHLGVGRQCGQPFQRCQHLLWRTLKQATTAAAEQRVAAKQNGGGLGLSAKICNVPGRVAWHIQHLKIQTHGMDLVTILQAVLHFSDLFPRRTVDHRTGGFAQFLDTARVIAVVVRD